MKLMPTITINPQVSLYNPSVYMGLEHLLLLAIIEAEQHSLERQITMFLSSKINV